MTVASSGAAGGKGALVRSVKRTSGLAAPIVSLGGAHRVSRGVRCVGDRQVTRRRGVWKQVMTTN